VHTRKTQAIEHSDGVLSNIEILNFKSQILNLSWFRSTMDSISDSDSEDAGSIPAGTTTKSNRLISLIGGFVF
jgi:hypothetical protein